MDTAMDETEGFIEYLDEDAELVQQIVKAEPVQMPIILEDIQDIEEKLPPLLIERPIAGKKRWKTEGDDSDYDPTEDMIATNVKSKKKKPQSSKKIKFPVKGPSEKEKTLSPSTLYRVAHTMPRRNNPDSGGKKYRRYPKELIEQAVQEYRNGGVSLSVISRKFEIDKSVLHRHSVKNMKTQGGQTVLSKETELAFITYINLCAEWGYFFGLYDIRLLVKKYLDKLGVTEKRFKDNMPGPDFARSFLKRHKDKISQKIKRNRNTVSSDVIKQYFEQLKQSISDIPIDNIVNYDEINLADDPDQKKMITKRGSKYPKKGTDHSKVAVSIMMACTAAGEMLPPYVVYKAQILYDTWTKFGPRGTRYNGSQSGWFDVNIFDDWVSTMILPFFENKLGKKCLIGDNLSSHLSIDLIRKCQEKDIQFVFLPANSTHITQPLDVALFRPIKMAWRNIILGWKKTDGRNESLIPKDCFPKLLSKLMDNLMENGRENIIEGFKETGIHPFDPSAVLNKLPDWNKKTDTYECVDQAVLELLKEMKYGTFNIVKEERQEKLNVKAEKSVLCPSDKDYIKTESEYTSASSSVPVPVKKIKLEDLKSTNKLSKEIKGKKCTREQFKRKCQDQVVASCSYNISPYDVNPLPVIFEDDQDGIEQIEIVVENYENLSVNQNLIKQKNRNIEILSKRC